MYFEFNTGILFGAVLGIFLTLVICTSTAQTNKEIVNHNCAEYNSTTGNFQWKDNNDN